MWPTRSQLKYQSITEIFKYSFHYTMFIEKLQSWRKIYAYNLITNWLSRSIHQRLCALCWRAGWATQSEWIFSEWNWFWSWQPVPSALWFCYFHTSGSLISEPTDSLQNTKTHHFELATNISSHLECAQCKHEGSGVVLRDTASQDKQQQHVFRSRDWTHRPANVLMWSSRTERERK